LRAPAAASGIATAITTKRRSILKIIFGLLDSRAIWSRSTRPTAAPHVAPIRARTPAGRTHGENPRQVLPFDLAAASAYADVVTVRDNLDHPIDSFDAQIAAICRAQAATLATRNTKDFTHTGITIVDPWHGSAS
jgi:predicted nucleic acid-binding protein